ncbi:MAG TPA: sensor histidine kinase [Deinococcales bacterium]|nr:sensor histidine kinase [Deinococcales bacterium]
MISDTRRSPAEHTIVTIRVASDPDVVVARQRTRQVAALLGLDDADQTRMVTAVSEIARNALMHAGGGTVRLIAAEAPPCLVARVEDKGPGIANLDDVLAGRHQHAGWVGRGVVGAVRLMDDLQMDSATGAGTTVTMRLAIPRGTPAPTAAISAVVAQELARRPPAGPYEELHRQNQDILAALEELRATNEKLEDRVRERTRELQVSNAEQDVFIYTASHDMRTPLLSILGMGEMLRQAVAGGDAEQADFLLTRVLANADRMSALLDSLLQLSRVGRVTSEDETVDLAGALREALEELEPLLASRAASVEVAGSYPAVRFPRTELYQVITNLIGNAAKYAGRAGETPKVELHASTSDGWVTLAVQDNGPGVPARFRERIFELFRQLDLTSAGTGVGLTIVKRIVERHGGRVWVEDSPLGGAAFVVTLPQAPGKEEWEDVTAVAG